MSGIPTLCYCTAVKKGLQAETLTQALQHLILYNEMLQVRLENGRYIPESGVPEQHNELLSTYDCAGKSSAEIETFTEMIINNLSGEMGCERGASIRAALLNIDNDFNKLLLLSHRAIVDQRGHVLILEDLYRIYEQLSNKKKVALRPVCKTYLEFIKEAVAAKKMEFDEPLYASQFTQSGSETGIYDTSHGVEANQPKTNTVSVILDQNMKRRLFSWRLAAFDLTPAEALFGALLRSLNKATERDSASIWIKSDYRLTDQTLKYTVGAMTQTYRLPSDFAEERGLFSDTRKLRGALRAIPLFGLSQNSPHPASQLSKGSNTGLQLRLNLEYLTDEPWLGGDEWLPEGFIVSKQSLLTGSYSIDVIPLYLSDRIDILIKYRETPEIRALVEKFANCLLPELEIILRYCNEYVDAKEFWLSEFAKATTQAKIQIENDNHKATEKGRASLIYKADKSVMDQALRQFDADESQLLLAAYGVLISRLTGCEDFVLLCALDTESLSTVFPLRLNPVWASSFRLFVEEVKAKLRQAAPLGQYAFDVLNEEQTIHGRTYPLPGVGYVFKQTSIQKSIEQRSIDVLEGYAALNQVPDLVLDIFEFGNDLDVFIVYEKSCFGAEIIKRLGVYLSAILEAVTANASIKLGDIQFDRDQKVYEMASSLAEDAFNF
jgi:Condensation domain